MNNLKPLLLGLMLMGSFTTNASDAYLGFGIGDSYIDQDIFGESDTGYKFFAGLKFHPNFAVEAAYMDLGQPVEDFFGFREEFDVWAVALWAKGIWPVTERIDLFGKLGFAHWEYDKTIQPWSLPPTTTSESANDFGWGLGIGFDVGKKWAIPIEYEQISGDIDTAGMFSISVIYQF
jgi:opacity protein-like surface antigen